MPKVLLGRGARGDLVRKVQIALTARGFDPHGADGGFGKDTEAAVKAFQQASSFEPTGKVDVSTWSALLNTQVPAPLEAGALESAESIRNLRAATWNVRVVARSRE